MHAQETQVRVLLEGQKQFFVPLFQRIYSWERSQWQAIWDDISDLYKNGADARHFLGSIVSKSLPGTPEGVSPFMIIDGQQRLTTLSILLMALRDACSSNDPDLSAKIQNLYLTNQYAPGGYHQKLLPTPTDRPIYSGLLSRVGTDTNASNMHAAFAFFCQQLGNPSIDLQRLEQAIVSGLEVVSITLGQTDNEYRIFESLNAKGLPLSQADLLRNYFFMRIRRGQQEVVYNELWRPMEESLGPQNLEAFFRYQYMSTGQFLREREIHARWARRLEPLDEAELIEELTKLARYSRYYQRLVDPGSESHPSTKIRLQRLNRWGGQTMYPFMLWVYEQAETGRINADGIAEVLLLIESFLVRRLFAGVPTNQLNRLFIRLSQQLPGHLGIVDGLRTVLSESGRRWPRDAAFREGILKYPLYSDSRPGQRRIVLETLESSYGHREPALLEGLTVEHVMPQDLTPEWAAALDDGARETHRSLVHTLGNLTLTGYNPELSNRPYAEKRVLLSESHLAMNQEIAREPGWGADEILRRGASLAGRAVNLWPGPKD